MLHLTDIIFFSVSCFVCLMFYSSLLNVLPSNQSVYYSYTVFNNEQNPYWIVSHRAIIDLVNLLAFPLFQILNFPGEPFLIQSLTPLHTSPLHPLIIHITHYTFKIILLTFDSKSVFYFNKITSYKNIFCSSTCMNCQMKFQN